MYTPYHGIKPEQLIVKVKQGKLQGVFEGTAYHAFYIGFMGIPYAAPPIGELRFKDPEPPASWEGVRDAKIDRCEGCIQFRERPFTTLFGSEDCLHLSVYASLPFSPMTRKPVMVWIHGGNFLSGAGNHMEMRPDYFMMKEVILVSINYRLGALGFLNLGHEVASGNQGLKDQIAALKWIKENIQVFGGNPNNITVFGSYTGAVSAHLLALSPLSKGLFHKVILQSGVATMKWAIIEDQPEVNSFKLAAVLGNDSKDPEEVVKFLQAISADRIIEAQYDIKEYSQETRIGKLIFGPTIDTNAKYPFLPCPVRELLDNDNNIPIMLGHTSYEYTRFLKDTKQATLDELYEDLPLYVEKLVGSKEPEEITRLTKRFKQWYFNDKPFTQSCIPAIVQCMSDIHFNIPIKNFVNDRRKKAKAPTYFYQFSYVGNEKVFMKELWYNVKMPGSSHADELPYLYYMPDLKSGNRKPPEFDTEDFKMLIILTSMWTNFANMGNPTYFINKHINISWQSATTDNFNYLDIDKELRLLTIAEYKSILDKKESSINEDCNMLQKLYL